MPEMSKSRKRLIIAVLTLGALLLSFTVVEVGLKIFLPFPRPATIGHRGAETANLYGWGFSPGEPIAVWDPDTGERYSECVNNHAWRDLDRSFENRTGSYRILVLGDSVTYGAIVSLERLYTRVLQERFRARGYNVEVISMGYGGWGTDQELEALQNEGMKYSPNLVVVQFCGNDIEDNLHAGDRARQIPFSYSLDGQGALERHLNPEFKAASRRFFDRENRCELILWSEIGKRIYATWTRARERETASPTGYRISEQAIHRVERAFLLGPAHPLVTALKGLPQTPDRGRLGDLVRAHGLGDREEELLRALEDRWFQSSWSPELYAPPPPDFDSPGWKLYFKLVEQMQRVTAAKSTPIVLFSETDLGSYEFCRFWFRISPDDAYLAGYLAPTRAIQEFASRSRMEFCPQKRKYVRARNDPHANGEGNQAMAEDLLDYLLETHKEELEKHRSNASGKSAPR
jgi:lysophospholipase L1-like esterase